MLANGGKVRMGTIHQLILDCGIEQAKAMEDSVWIRQGGSIKLRIESGTDANDAKVGLPYGAIARIILLYLQTEAVRTRSREVELGRSMNQWLTAMGIDNGGKTYRLVREQSRRLTALIQGMAGIR